MRKLNAILLVLALALLIYFVHRVGLGPIVAGFVQVGWGFLLLLGIFVVAFVLETWNWSRCLRAPPPFTRFLIPSWCGQSINQLTPGSSLGEVVKGGLLANVTSTEAVVSSLILYNMAYAYGTAVVILAGSVGLWLLGFAPLALRAGGSGLALAIFTALLLFHRGLLRGTISRLLRRLAVRRGGPAASSDHRSAPEGREDPGPRLQRAADHMARWETEIRLGAEERPWRFPQVVAVNLVTQAFPIIELWLTWLLLGVRLDLARCFIFAGIDTLVNVVFLVVPGKLGIAEGTTYFTSELLRLNPTTGLTKQLVGRSVRLVFSIAGALVLAAITVRKPRVAKQPAVSGQDGRP